MNLKEYLFYKKMTHREFAKKADLSPACISGIVRFAYNPTPKTIRAIERASEGKVTAETIFLPTTYPQNWEDKDKVA